MKTVSIPKEVFGKILEDVGTLIDEVELALDAKVQQRKLDIDTGRVKGKTEKDLDDYLKRSEE